MATRNYAEPLSYQEQRRTELGEMYWGPGKSPENNNQHSETRSPRWLTCTAEEFINKWLPQLEDEAKKRRNQGQG
jgi:hypothetical protein